MKYFSRNLLLVALISAGSTVAIVPQAALAYDIDSTSVLDLDEEGVAIRGFDPVAYFKVGKPTEGSAKFTASYKGATYHFANASNRNAFKAAPAKYEPQFGGFCAMGAALSKKLDGDPEIWHVVDKKLYLIVNKDADAAWLKDVPGYLVKANDNWPKIRDKAPKDL
ncbi:MAG: YHS domain-containing protein [Gallionella sp.]|nr:YHS domain-containing protein [Gallionella sp.]